MTMGYFISWQLLALIAFSDLLRSDQSEVLLKSRGVPNLDWGSYMVPQLRERMNLKVRLLSTRESSLEKKRSNFSNGTKPTNHLIRFRGSINRWRKFA